MALNIVLKPADLNHALFQITHGLYILTSAHEGRVNGQCLDALMQVTNTPPRVAISVAKKNFTHNLITNSRVFAVNMLDNGDKDALLKVKTFGLQSGRNVDKFASEPYQLGENDCPILSGTKAFFECKVLFDRTIEFETHTIFFGLVTRAGVSEDSNPLTYNEYRQMRKK